MSSLESLATVLNNILAVSKLLDSIIAAIPKI
jgi:hypothetical protein